MSQCEECDEEVAQGRVEWLRSQKMQTLCLKCGDKAAKKVKHCILTLHKQGPMAFTAEFGRVAAVGANNKGGIVR